MNYLDIVQEHVETARARYQVELARVGDPDHSTADFERAQAALLALSNLYDELMTEAMAAEPETVEGVPINPELPEDFDNTPNDERPTDHIVWWHKPYIVTDEWPGRESWEDYRDRLALAGFDPDKTPEQWDQFQEDLERNWFAAYPTGTRYEVRCLDGGAWDRSTIWGVFPTLDDAVAAAKGGN